MKLRNYFSIGLLSIFSLNAYAIDLSWDKIKDNSSEVDLKFGGWSHHSSSKEGYMDIPLNENHKGLGIEYYKSLSETDKHWVGSGLWYMKDSFDNDSVQVSMAYKYRLYIDYLIHSLDFNINAGVTNRTYIYRLYGKAINDQGVYEKYLKDYNIERETRFTFSPMVTVNFTENLHADFTYMPESLADQNDSYELFFFRLGYKFN